MLLLRMFKVFLKARFWCCLYFLFKKIHVFLLSFPTWVIKVKYLNDYKGVVVNRSNKLVEKMFFIYRFLWTSSYTFKWCFGPHNQFEFC